MIKINDTLHARCDVIMYEEALLSHVQATVDLDQGSVGVLGNYVTGEREIKVLNQATTTSAVEDLVLVCAPELVYDQSLRTNSQFKKFYNEKNVATRAYQLKNVKRFKVSAEALDSTGAITVGQYIVPQAGYKLAVSATSTNAIGKIIRIDQEGIPTYLDASGSFVGNTYPMYVIEVL